MVVMVAVVMAAGEIRLDIIHLLPMEIVVIARPSADLMDVTGMRPPHTFPRSLWPSKLGKNK